MRHLSPGADSTQVERGKSIAAARAQLTVRGHAPAPQSGPSQMAPVIDAAMVMTIVVPNAHLKTYR